VAGDAVSLMRELIKRPTGDPGWAPVRSETTTTAEALESVKAAAKSPVVSPP